MDKQLYIPLKLEESTIKGFEEMFSQIAQKTLEDIYRGNNIQPYLNKKQASEYIGISFNTLKKFIDDGLPIIDVAGVQMIRKIDIDQFLETKRI
ncbi:helix-turn-helix domain-containing protein [Macrococcus equipercicus]|uniref:Helix-turn-helix domain-containing protein n=1 Tax=Macrococcus equipercicus TaxID=69967 RepID=A0A9Q9BW27_9STAP|nr:helix-turn-helix domain-containing protein [Macrococcus equipercicus]UTH14063.1 helix-turn-helix domain-containing protein [Macrococcus equipercicus]